MDRIRILQNFGAEDGVTDIEFSDLSIEQDGDALHVWIDGRFEFVLEGILESQFTADDLSIL